MENDVLRSGAIFKLTNKDLERVRSPPLVKFNIPKERSSEKPAPKDQVRETFLEIYRQTPVPQMAGKRRMSTSTTSNIDATDSLNKSYKVDYSSVTSSGQKKDDRMSNSTINSYPEKVQEDNVDYGDRYEQDDDEVVVEKVEPIISKVPSGRTSKVNKNESMDVSSKTQVTQAETSTISNTSIVTKNHIAADVPQPPGTFRSGSASRGSGSTGSSSSSNTGSRSRAGGRSSNQTGDSLLLLFGAKPTTSTTTTTVSIRNSSQTSRVAVSNSTAQPKSSPSSMDTAIAPVVAPISATPHVEPLEPPANPKQQQKARKENTTSKPNTLPTHDLLQNSSKNLSTDEVSATGTKESLLVKRSRTKSIKDNLETSQPNKQKKRLNKKEKLTTIDSDSSEILLTDSGVSREVISDTAESGPESSLYKHKKHTTATRKSSASSTGIQKPRRGRPVGKLTKNKITPGIMNITQESKEMTEKIHNTSGSGDSEGNNDHSSTDAGMVDNNDPVEVQSSTDEAATVTRSGRQSIPRKVIPLLSETERQTKATERAALKVSTKRGRPPKTTAETTARSVKPKSKSSSSTDNMINHHAYNLHSAIREVADSSGWTPAQKVALYSVQSRIDVRASDFWEQVSDALGELGIEKTSTECSVKWFEKVEDARIRKEKKAAEDREKSRKKAEMASKVTVESTKESVDSTKEIALAGVKAIEEPVKAKRIGKAQLKRLAGEAMKATHEDDIFESTGMQSISYWADSAAITTAVTLGQDVLSQEMLLDLSGADNELIISKNSNNNSGSGDGYAGERAKLSEQEEMDFATSHVHKLNYRRPLAYSRTKPTNVNDKNNAYPTKQSKTTTTAIARIEREYHTLQKEHQQQEEENSSDEEELHSEEDDDEEDS